MQYIKLRDMEDENFNVYFRTLEDDKKDFIQYLVGIWHEQDCMDEENYEVIKEQLQEFDFLDRNVIEDFINNLQSDFQNGLVGNVVEFIESVFERFSLFIEEITFDEIDY